MRAHTVLAVALGLFAIPFSCASTGTAADSSLNATMNLRDCYQQLLTQVDSTVKALDTIQAQKDVDLKGAYNGFVDAANRLDSQTKAVESAAKTLRSETASYIKNWEQRMTQIQNATIRKSSDERRKAAQARFDSAKAELDRIAKDYDSFTSDVTDIRTALNFELTAGNVDALKGSINGAKKKAGSVKKDISKIIDALDKLSDAMKTSKAAEEKTGS